MKIRRDGDNRIEIIQHDFLLGIWMALFGAGVCYAGFVKFSGGKVGGLEALEPAGDLGVLAAGLALSIGGVLLCRRRDLVFDRARQEMVWRSVGLIGSKTRKVPFSHIGRAYVDYNPMQGPEWGRNSASRLAVQLTNGSLPFSEVYDGNSAATWERAVKAINDFIDRKPES